MRLCFVRITKSPVMFRSLNIQVPIGPFHDVKGGQTFIVASRSMTTKSLGQQLRTWTEPLRGCRFVKGSTVIVRPKLLTVQRSFRVNASWVTASQLARGVFTLGTAAVLPFYSLMVFAPKASMTKKTIGSDIPYLVLGLLYAYLLYLSWKPATIRLMFSGKYWLPELSGIAKMFSNEMTLASAWIHLLAIDLFAARQVFLDGLEKHVETRHSVSLCLFCCPIGIVAHVITRALGAMASKREEMQSDVSTEAKPL